MNFFIKILLLSMISSCLARTTSVREAANFKDENDFDYKVNSLDLEDNNQNLELSADESETLKAQLIPTLYVAGVSSILLINPTTKKVFGYFIISAHSDEYKHGKAKNLGANKIDFKGYLYHLPGEYTFDKKLGEGSIGVVFLVKKMTPEGEVQTTLKYFKDETAKFLTENILRIEEIAKKSVLSPDKLSPQEQDFLMRPSSEIASDLLYGAQQETEKATFLGVTLEEFRDPDMITNIDLKKRVLEAKKFGVGSIQAVAVDITVTASDGKLKTVTVLEKRLISGKLLKEFIESGQIDADIVIKIEEQIRGMSQHGISYADLNEANWFVETRPDGTLVLTPFDMKPGLPVKFTEAQFIQIIPGWSQLSADEQKKFLAKEDGDYLDKLIRESFETSASQADFKWSRQDYLEAVHKHLIEQKKVLAAAETAKAMAEKTDPLASKGLGSDAPSFFRENYIRIKQVFFNSGLYHAKINSEKAQRSMNLINQMLDKLQTFQLQRFKMPAMR